MDPLLDGSQVFGTACHVVHSPVPVAMQKDAFFGISGVVALYGGSRGRTFQVDGVLVGDDLPSVIAAEGVLLSYADGIARTFTDTQGRSWPNVIFEGEYQPLPEGPKATDFGWCLPYRCMLHGLS
jgi:hypothetical protein